MSTALRPGLRIGVDLGGTKIEAVGLLPDGQEAGRQRIPTPRDDYAGTIEAIAGLVAEIERQAGGRGSVGIGMPGSITPATGRVQNANSTWLNGQPFGQDLQARLQRPVRLANDANCFAISEATDGAAAGARSVFGVILGTGCGGGIVIEGRLLEGPRAIAGEWGHTPLPWVSAEEVPGIRCWCGRMSCMETWISGPALAADHRRATGEAIDAEAIVARAEGGDGAAAATLQRHASRLARGLAAIVNILDPEVIVLGGGLARLSHLYTLVPELMAPYIFTDAPHTAEAPLAVLRPPRWGDASGVRGAAWLWPAS